MMGLEGKVAVHSNVGRRFRPENNADVHLTIERICNGDVRPAFSGDCPNLLLI